MVSDDFLPSRTGAGVHTRYISSELAKRGHHVVVITTRRKGQPSQEDWNGVKVYRTFSIEVFDFRISLASKSKVRSILAENQIDVIHYQYAGILLKRTFAVSRQMEGITHVYTYNMTVDHLTQDSRVLRFFGPLMQAMLHKFCNACDLITVPSKKLMARLRSDGIKTPLVYLSNAVGLDGFEKCEPHTRTSSFVLLFVGRLHPEKNIPFLLEAFSHSLRSGNDLELWLVGRGYLRNKLEAICERLGISDRVKFFGHVDHGELAKYYSAADVFILPSLVETQGMVAIEAMYFGKPVIVTDSIVSAEELVEHGHNGYIADHTSTRDLSAKIIQLEENPGLCEQMGFASKRRSERFSTLKIVDELEQLYMHSP